MKRINLLFLLSALFVAPSFAEKAQRTDVNEVLNLKEKLISKKKIDLKDGFYEVEVISGGEDLDYEMLVTSSRADKEHKYIVILPENVRKAKSSGEGFFLQARPISKGKALMLTGLNITSEGDFAVESESSDRAPVGILSSKGKGVLKHDFIIQSRQGGIDGMTFGIKKKSKKRHPVLRSYAKNGMFVAGSRRRGVKALVLEDELTLYSKHNESTYEMIQINDDNTFNALTTSEFDTMGEYSVSYEKVKNISFFFDTYESREEFLVVGRPMWAEGKYRMTAYQSGSISWIKKVFINLFD